jgi:hypothetical protein
VAALPNYALPSFLANFTVFFGTGDAGVLVVGLVAVMMSDKKNTRIESRRLLVTRVMNRDCDFRVLSQRVIARLL